MKQENKFVAQLFHYLARFVDLERDLFICVDGGAAKHHAGRKDSPISDPDIPDLWLALSGKKGFTGIEAKVLDNQSISVRQGQLRAWRSDGSGKYRPSFWVAVDQEFKNFYCWRHSTLIPRLDKTKSTTANVRLSINDYPADHHSQNMAQLALYILSEA